MKHLTLLLHRVIAHLREVIYGMALHDTFRYLRRTRGSLEHVFLIITIGDLLGIPLLPPYHTLRLLPYLVPEIAAWKRRMLRERDLTELIG